MESREHAGDWHVTWPFSLFCFFFLLIQSHTSVATYLASETHDASDGRVWALSRPSERPWAY